MRKIVADAMLVKLVRWLRMAGVNAHIPRNTDDDYLIGYARRNRAVLLTSDLALSNRARKNGFEAIYIMNGTLDGQLRQTIKALKVKPRKMPAMICPVCGSGLAKTTKEKAEGKVHENVLKKFRAFYLCRKCGKVYWKGTHWNRIRERLRHIAVN